MVRALVSPRMLLLHVGVLVCIAGAIVAGRWQWGVWQGHRVDQATLLEHAVPRPLDGVLHPDAAFPAAGVGQPVRFAGRWLPADTVYVAGKHDHGRAGYWAVTPVLVCGTGGSCAHASAMPVVRGFVTSTSSAPAAPQGPVAVVGWLQPADASGVIDQNPHDDVVPQLRTVDLIPHVRQDLYGGYVIARTAGTGTTGLVAVTPASLPSPGSWTGLRNLLYATQWWLFGAFAVFLWWRWVRDEVTRVTGVPSSP